MNPLTSKLPESSVNPPEHPAAAAVSRGERAARDKNASVALWVQRISLVVFVVFCIELGMLLAVLPWTRVWTENSLLLGRPALRAIAHLNFVRGLVSGLGLIDIWIGIWEAVHYRESKIT